MPAQLSFGFEPAPSSNDPLFFAIYPDAQAATRIGALAELLRRQHGLKGRPLQTHNFHITLHYFGDAGLSEREQGRAREAAATMEMPPFRVAFDRAGSFRRNGGHPCVLLGEDGVAGLAAFHEALFRQLSARKLPGKRSFVPHLTLLYDARMVDTHAIAPVTWTVREFRLVRSHVRRSWHELLGRWPLCGESSG